jgi:NADH-quinone oxidoreductase subunit F
MEKPLSRNIRPDREPLSLKEYEKAGGYQAVRKALKSMEPKAVTECVKKSNLRGRGGAGFPTGMKWGFVPMGDDAPRTKFLVVNADEMEPSTFKDRFLLEGDPHQLIEGVIVSAFAIQATTAYIFLRWAYRRAAGLLQRSIAEAKEAGYLGQDILGSGFHLDIHLHISAGRYMCGEESALLNALEGRRAMPRSRPPFPPVVGAWGLPTVVNNVETLCNVPHIVNNGAEWFKGLSFTENGGTKIFGVSGKVRKPGAWELPMGTTIREILEEHAGGLQDGLAFRGVIPGGGSTDFLVEEHLDLKMDYDTVQKAGSRMGTGTLLILDDRTCPVGLVHNLEQFFAQESCGWCTPCREGLPWIARILGALEKGEGQPEDMDRLRDHTHLLGMGHTFCALAPGAVEPLQSALKYFEDDFLSHIREKRCPWR